MESQILRAFTAAEAVPRPGFSPAGSRRNVRPFDLHADSAGATVPRQLMSVGRSQLRRSADDLECHDRPVARRSLPRRQRDAAGARHVTGDVHGNFLPIETDRAAGPVAASTRPAAMKTEIDPDNEFQLNQNAPAKARRPKAAGRRSNKRAEPARR